MMRRLRWFSVLVLGLAALTALGTAGASGGGGGNGGAAAAEDDFWNVQLRYAGEFGGFRIAAAAGVNDRLSINYVETPSPDFLLVSPGGIASPPPPCIAASFTVVRCPAAGGTNMDVSMGPGNDVIETSGVNGPSVSGFRLKVATGPGKDRWLGGPLGEFWIGGPGSDFAQGQEGKDRFSGGPGNDRMFGGPGIDFFLGGPGNDFGRGGGGNDRGFDGSGNNNYKD